MLNTRTAKREASRTLKGMMIEATGKGLESVRLVNRIVEKTATDMELRRVYKVAEKTGNLAAFFEVA